MTFSVTKDPQAILPYTMNWASEDGTNDGSDSDTGWLQGDTIDSSTWSITGPDSALVNDTDSNGGVSATITLSGGTSGRIYTATNHIVTANGLEDDRSITVTVTNK